jgi:hypothetical protein
MSDSDDDPIAFLIGLGVLALAGIGMYKLLKSFDSYQAGEVIPAAQVPSVATSYSSSGNYSYAYCYIHGDSEQCQATDVWHKSSDRCIECNGGIGDKSGRWCKSCDDDWHHLNDD